MGQWLDYLILVVFSKFNNSMILFKEISCWQTGACQDTVPPESITSRVPIILIITAPLPPPQDLLRCPPEEGDNQETHKQAALTW